MTIYKAFLRPLIDYGNIIYHQPQNQSFCEKLDIAQHKAALAITGAIQGISRDRIYQELDLESVKLSQEHGIKRLSSLFKTMKEEAPFYLINLVPKCEINIKTKNSSILTFNCLTDCFKYSFFPSTLNHCFNLDLNIGNSESISILKK